MDTFKDVIRRWKSAEELAAELGRKPVTVRQWGNRGNIPPEYWPALVAAAQRCGFTDVTLEKLTQLSVARRQPNPQEAA